MLRVESRLRARALQVLYVLEVSGDIGVDSALAGVARLTRQRPLMTDDVAELVDGILEQRATIDRLAQEAAQNWRLDRIAAVERNVLRIGIYELLTGRVPAKVAIDQAIWLAHRFGDVRAPAFINGVLDKVGHELGRL
ncbi:MAG: transcription antitermination factor NusB [Gemmatimonadales bacterium]